MNASTIEPIRYCRLCRSTNLVSLFSLGEQYVSDFVEKDKVYSGIKCPIELVLCQACTLVQQRYTAPSDFMYTRKYWYRSGTTQTMRDALKDVVVKSIELTGVGPGDVVLDIGANDGTLLATYELIKRPMPLRVACEPAVNLQEECSKHCDVLLDGFWSESRYACGVGYGVDSDKAKVITALGMLYDLEDPNQFVADIANVLHPEGVFIAQLMCLKNMLNICDVGNLCHEHLEFYSFKSLEYLLEKHGLSIFDMEKNSVNGESYRIYACHNNKYKSWQLRMTREGLARIDVYRREETDLDQPKYYHLFYQEMVRNKEEIYNFISKEVGKGKRVWVLGASTKGNALLQWWELNHLLIENAAERSPEKWGKYTVGTGIEIHPEKSFRWAEPDYAIILPYTFADEIMEREKEWHDRGGRFLIPLPRLRIV